MLTQASIKTVNLQAAEFFITFEVVYQFPFSSVFIRHFASFNRVTLSQSHSSNTRDTAQRKYFHRIEKFLSNEASLRCLRNEQKRLID